MGRGRHEQAIFEIETAMDLEPTQRFYQKIYGRALFYSRRYPEAEAQFKRMLEMDQTSVSSYSWLLSSMTLQGNEVEAFEWFKKFLSIQKADEETFHVFERTFQTSGWRGVLSEWIKRCDR